MLNDKKSTLLPYCDLDRKPKLTSDSLKTKLGLFEGPLHYYKTYYKTFYQKQLKVIYFEGVKCENENDRRIKFADE